MFTIDTVTLFAFFGTFQGLIFAVIFWYKNHTISNRIFSWLLVATSIRIAKNVFVHLRMLNPEMFTHYELWRILVYSGISHQLAIGPLFWFYFQSKLNPKFKWKNPLFWHFVPYIGFVITGIFRGLVILEKRGPVGLLPLHPDLLPAGTSGFSKTGNLRGCRNPTLAKRSAYYHGHADAGLLSGTFSLRWLRWRRTTLYLGHPLHGIHHGVNQGKDFLLQDKVRVLAIEEGTIDQNEGPINVMHEGGTFLPRPFADAKQAVCFHRHSTPSCITCDQSGIPGEFRRLHQLLQA